jgi:hypothetical protein
MVYGRQIIGYSLYLILIEPERRSLRYRMGMAGLAQIPDPLLHTPVNATCHRRRHTGDTVPVYTVTRFAAALNRDSHSLRHKFFYARHLQAEPFLLGYRWVIEASAKQTEYDKQQYQLMPAIIDPHDRLLLRDYRITTTDSKLYRPATLRFASQFEQIPKMRKL